MMLVIRVLWLQAALAMAQLPTLDDLLEGERVVEKTTPSPPGLLDLIGGDAAQPVPTVASTEGGLLDPLLDPIIGSTGILNGGEKAPVTSTDTVVEVPVTPAPDPILVPVPTPVETVEETPPPKVVVQPPGLPAPESTSVTEKTPPLPPPPPVPVAVDEQEKEVQQPVEEVTVPSPAPAPDPIAGPGPVPAPNTEEAAVPAPEVTAPAIGGGANVFVPPAAASPTQDGAAANSPAAAPVPNVDSSSSAAAPAPTLAANNGANSNPGAAQTTGTPVIQTASAQEPILTLVTAGGSTFMSVFVPPASTQAVAIIQGTGFPSSSTSSDLSSEINISSPFVDASDPSAPDSPSPPPPPPPPPSSSSSSTSSTSSSSSAPSGPSGGLSTETKIGVGVGLGVGSVVFAVVVTYLLWHKRMRSGPFRPKRGHQREGSDLEKGDSGTLPQLQEKQKLDWESERDTPFDFGFSKETGSVK